MSKQKNKLEKMVTLTGFCLVVNGHNPPQKGFTEFDKTLPLL